MIEGAARIFFVLAVLCIENPRSPREAAEKGGGTGTFCGEKVFPA